MKITRPFDLELVKTLAMIVTLFVQATAQASGCEPWAARLVSAQVLVEFRESSSGPWHPARLDDTYCLGDSIRTGRHSRAAIVLSDDTIIRLDQDTTITVGTAAEDEPSWLQLLEGIVHFFSRVPRSLDVRTPFVNAGIEGTEFVVAVDPEHAAITVFEGSVAASNPQGTILVERGESVIAERGMAPTPRTVVDLRDTVQWALHYPPIIDSRPPESWMAGDAWQGSARESLERYRTGDLTGAFTSLAGIQTDNIDDPSFFNYRAALLLSVGRADEAEADLNHASALAPGDATAAALRSVLALAQGRRSEALELAASAAAYEPASSVAKIALSYARQAMFDIRGAREAVEQAVAADPDNALAWARLSELWQSEGYLDRSLSAAEKAVELNADLARTQSVLGFAYLTETKIQDARTAFERAMVLDQGDPLPQLGLGLALIRIGKLSEGRRRIEIAAGLDPNNSLIRSYLGKAYFEERRNTVARSQFDLASELDPYDPTPLFYGAIQRQSDNDPVGALRENQKSIELNENRGVFRSRFLLDDDLAARSASLGQIFRDLGFQQLALVEGWKAVGYAPDNHSAHRLLADSYSVLPRHGVARVNELLQAQLLQPLNITPIQPQLAQSNLGILDGAGPSNPSFGEFNPMFVRNRLALQLNGIAGSNSTLGDDLVFSGVQNKVSFSVGQYHYETDGFRDNNDQTQNIYNAFLQFTPSSRTSLQGELRRADFDRGDLELLFTGDFNPDLRQTDEVDTVRLGLRHALSPRSTVLASAIRQDAKLFSDVIPGFFTLDSDIEQRVGEAQYIYNSPRLNMIAGIGHREIDDETTTTFDGFPGSENLDTSFDSVYLYSDVGVAENLNVTIGASADFFAGANDVEDRDQFNPKLGLIWGPDAATTVRAAAFRTLQRPLISLQDIDPSLEPTQVAGFNQFFEGGAGDEAWRYGVATDRTITRTLFGGVELSARDLDVVFLDVAGPSPTAFRREWEERLARLYLYWTPSPWLAVSGEYFYERFDRDAPEGFADVEQFTKLRTHRLPVSVRYFSPSRISTGVTATYISQKGDFVVGDDFGFANVPGEDDFWVVDAFIGYRLPKRFGLISLQVRNLFDEEFDFQDVAPGNPTVLPDRSAYLRFTLSL